MPGENFSITNLYIKSNIIVNMDYKNTQSISIISNIIMLRFLGGPNVI